MKNLKDKLQTQVNKQVNDQVRKQGLRKNDGLVFWKVNMHVSLSIDWQVLRQVRINIQYELNSNKS